MERTVSSPQSFSNANRNKFPKVVFVSLGSHLHGAGKMLDYRYRAIISGGNCSSKRGGASVNILVTGSTGLIGSSLVPLLIANGHAVTRLVRSKPRRDAAEIHWDPVARTLAMHELEGMDAVVHLAGESIAGGRWTTRKKLRIQESRWKGTSVLVEHLSPLRQPPRYWSALPPSATTVTGAGNCFRRRALRVPASLPIPAGIGRRLRSRRSGGESALFICGPESFSAPAVERWGRCCCRFDWAWEAKWARDGNT